MDHYTCWMIDKHGKRTAVQIGETSLLEIADSFELCFTTGNNQIVLIGHAICLGNDEVGADRLAEKITDIEVQRLAGGVILINPAQSSQLVCANNPRFRRKRLESGSGNFFWM